MPPLLERELVHSIVGGFYSVNNYYGFGLSEVVYASGLTLELRDRGHRVERELRVDVEYKGRRTCWMRLDMVVDDKVVVELKVGESLPRGSERQLMNYLRASRYEVGVLLHFGLDAKFYRFIDRPKRRIILADACHSHE
jgi:GxxExxY protein